MRQASPPRSGPGVFLAVVVLLSMVSSSGSGLAQAVPDSRGTDFWLAFSQNFYADPTLTLHLSSEVNTSGTVTVPGLAFSSPFTVTAGTVTEVTVPVGAMLGVNDGVENKGVHVTALDEVAVYGFNRHSATTDAFLGLPVDVLGTDYMVLGYRNTGATNASQFAVVGTVNGTTVTITPSVTTGTRVGGVPYNITLNQGQVYVLVNTTATGDLTGTIVESTQPVALFGGHRCANVPPGYFYCDHLVEQLPPTSAWGKTFVTVPLASRINGDTFRILAGVNATSVSINGSVVATLNAGQFHEQVISGASTIVATAPVLVAQYSNSQTFDGVSSDPFMMLIPPYELYSGDSMTVTPPGFTNFINVATPASGVGQLALDGVPVPSGSFTAIGVSGFYGAQLAVSAGSHLLTSPQAFGAFVYGFADVESYGYPASTLVAPIASIAYVTLTPETATNPVGTQHCVTATVTDIDFIPLAGIRVDFSVTGANPQSGFAITGVNGEAVYCYTGTAAGLDTITATASGISDTATKTWTAPPAITPTAGGITVVRGTTATNVEIATVTDPDTPFSGLTVTALSAPMGVTITGIVVNATSGAVTATVAATCGADPTGWATLQVSDGTATAQGTLAVNTTGIASTATVSGAASLCAGEPALLTVTLTGVAPWTLTWSDGFVQSGIAASPATRTVSPAVSTTYSITSMTDGYGCTGATSGSAQVTVNQRPVATVTGGGTICAGNVSTVSAALTGTAPWTLTWNDGLVQHVNASPATRQVNPSFNTSFSVVALSDGNCGGGTSTGSAAFVVKPLASAVITAPDSLCVNRTGYTASVPDGGPGVTYAWGITGGTITGATNGRTVMFNAPISLAGGVILPDVVLSVTVTRDGCPNSASKTMPVQTWIGVSGLYPANGTTGYQGAIVAWSPSSRGSYDVYFDTVTPPEKLLAANLVDNFEAFIPNWQPGVTYYWKVVSKTACFQLDSGILTLTTGSCAFTGAAPVLTSPLAGATGLPKSLTLTWNTVPGVSHFDVYLGPSAETLLRYEALPAERSSLAVDLAPGQTYFWKVVAVPVCGTSAPSESAVESFATAASNVTFGVVSPAFVNRWGFTGDLSLAGSGFVASSLLFTDDDGATAGTLTPSVFTNSFSNPNLLTATLVASATAPAGRYDVGVMEGAIEKGRSIQSLAVRAFTDVTEADYYFESSAEVADAGIMESDMDAEASGPQFTPKATVPRKLMAEYLAKAYQWWRTRSVVLPAATCATPDFPDVPCVHPNWLSIHWIKTWGITVGVPCAQGTCFNPDGSVSRAELVTFLDRMKQTAILTGLLSTTGETDPGCSQPYPACSGWADAGMKVAGWPRREANIAYSDRLTKGCAGTPGSGLAFCPNETVDRAQIGEFLARMVGLVPTP